ncbi:uncharacterized protein LOC113226357 [Hyposmocoma kahamanoa]|uniref:uncharacterized protein LOC113226357 n=1 Tax=Hyposmocoma kahamanoa TaxID=1477025 RepID=UPI000E6D990B|nr:uncharacterized protein LOC113226357 [Hyposmocoma kahamanoa]
MTALASEMSVTIKSLISSEMKALKTEITEVKESLSFINKEYEEFRQQHQSAIGTIEMLQSENLEMKSTIASLSRRVNHLEQQARMCNIEIHKAVGCKINPEDIHKCTRIAKLDPTGSRPRSIVVQLSSPRVRDEFLAAAVNYNRSKIRKEEKLNTSDIGITGEKKPIFIAEHLSPANKALHAAARSRARERNYKYVWVRNGKIFVRKDDHSDYILVKDMSSLKKLV